MAATREELLLALRDIATVNGISLTDGVAVPNHTASAEYLHPNHGSTLFVANVALAAATLLVVLARFWTRIFVAGGVGADDVTIGAAMIVVAGSTVFNCFGVKEAGIGKHFYDLSVAEVGNLLKFTFALPLVYTLGVAILKISILLFYRRLFGHRKRLQRIVLAFIAFQLVFAVASVFAYAFMCAPVHAYWTLELHAHACPTFKTTLAMYMTLRSVTVACDVALLLLPMRMVWDLKIPQRQRLGLAALFGLGLLACVVAVARLVMLRRLVLSLDVSWNVLPIALLDQTEQCLGIITASIPALTAVVSRYPPKPANSLMNPALALRYDFLSFAYDPDRQNLGLGCFATAYSDVSDERLVTKGEHHEMREGVINKTTTVTVNITTTTGGYRAAVQV
ncbi:hypothetical protein FN846DRAFT_74884 [Sphaerosporella brunnea]|uniref:Rhodopsin domain-containing protein n=1 Tax=Sphaerosporella brunnea TaxID=1250544 RepID=A0A5J5ESL9_9PEZI|nr:hypothetical protein FN846DRAFT_74884 [Sphaerosporella brunnea]